MYGQSADDPAAVALSQRFRGFDLPKDIDFNPTQASPDTLLALGLPPRPDRFRQPVLYKLWNAVFGRTLRFVQFVFPADLAADYEPFLRADFAGVSSTRFENSRNWSGAFIEPNADKSFIQMWGQWIVPTPQPPAGSVPPAKGTTTYQSAAWIGLDGQRLYRNSSLPQIGTLQAVSVAADGSQTFETNAWTQWWDRDSSKTLPITIPNFPVAHGDLIACVLTVLDPHTVLFNITNQSTKPFPTVVPIHASAPIICLKGFGAYQVSVTGATAEWVMERPTIIGTKTLQLFPDYGNIEFDGCHAVEALPGGVLPAGMNLRSARFIRMNEVRHAPERTVFISMPQRIDDVSFSVTHGDHWH